MVSDEEAYRQYLSGKEQAADMLVEKYGDALILYINGYMKDMQESEDLMIESFALIFAKERPIRGDGCFKAYLYKTARNLVLRHKQKYPVRFFSLDELEFELKSSEWTEKGIFLNERNQQLYRALEKLKKEYREALYLVYFEELSYRNAALVMAKSEQQITKLVYWGKQNLKKILEQEGFVYADE